MNVIKHLVFAGVFLASASVMLSSCDNNDWTVVDGASPTVSVEDDAIHVEPGMDVTIKCKISDADGISTIHLVCPELYLDKTIDIIDIYGEPLKEYNLNYKVQTERHFEGENFVVTLTVTDVAGNSVVKEIGANLDADFTPPYFNTKPGETVTVLIKNETKIKLNVDVADNRTVDYLELNLVKDNNGQETAVEGYPKRINGGDSRLAYSDAIVVPSEPAVYKLYITAADVEVQEPAHVISSVSTIEVKELPNFDEIYLADVKTAAQLNSDIFGVPVVMDHVGDYKYRVRYYNEKAGTEVCFLGQKSDFGPICFAPSKDNANELGDDPDEVNKIKLDKAETYYEFFVDTWNRTYTVNTYSIADAISPISHFHYNDYDLNTWNERVNDGDIWWQKFYLGTASGSPDNIEHEFEQDAKNPNLFYIYDWSVKAGDEIHFQITSWHSHSWWNFHSWRADKSEDPSRMEYYGLYWNKSSHYESNEDWFDFKYGSMSDDEFNYRYGGAPRVNIDMWNDESYRKAYVGDNWVGLTSPVSGKFKLVFDAHAERVRMVPQ